MIIKPSDVHSKEDFFEYMAGYMDDGDKLLCEHDEDTDELVYVLQSPSGYFLYGWQDSKGLLTYKTTEQ